MDMKAVISTGYRYRLGAIAVVCLGFGVWSVYDGVVVYPRHNRVVEQFQQFKSEKRLDQWPQHARAHGWSVDDPGSPKSQWSINTQYVQAAITLTLGVLFGAGFVRSFGRWIAVDDDGLTTSWGAKVRYDQIKSLDQKRWKTKGIAVVNYQDNSQKQKIVLDDWKYNREATVAIFKQVAVKLDADRIAGE